MVKSIKNRIFCAQDLDLEPPANQKSEKKRRDGGDLPQEPKGALTRVARICASQWHVGCTRGGKD